MWTKRHLQKNETATSLYATGFPEIFYKKKTKEEETCHDKTCLDIDN